MPAAQSYASSEESPAATMAAMIARTTKMIAPMAITGLPSPMRLVCEEGDCGQEGAGRDHEATGWGDEGALPARTGACHTAWAATVGAAGIPGPSDGIGAPHLRQNLSPSPTNAPQFRQYIFPSPAAYSTRASCIFPWPSIV